MICSWSIGCPNINQLGSVFPYRAMIPDFRGYDIPSGNPVAMMDVFYPSLSPQVVMEVSEVTEVPPKSCRNRAFEY